MLEIFLVGSLAAAVLVLFAFTIDEAKDRARSFEGQAPHRTRNAKVLAEPRWQRRPDAELTEEKEAA